MNAEQEYEQRCKKFFRERKDDYTPSERLMFKKAFRNVFRRFWPEGGSKYLEFCVEFAFFITDLRESISFSQVIPGVSK